MKQRLYLAGPMSGRPDYNFPAFREATARFRAAGWIVVSPVEVGEIFANDPMVHGSQYIREDLLHLVRCDAIALLPGWESSVGARCEVAVALTLGLWFYDADTTYQIDPPARAIVTGGYEQPPGVPDTLDGLADEARVWGNATFTQSTSASKAAHLLREATELKKEPDDLTEAADVFLLLAHLTDGRPFVEAVRAKLEANKLRTWGVPDAEGVVEHVAEGVA